MALSDYLRPEYLFRPSQIWQRVQQKLHPQVGDFDQVMLPWGLPLRVRSFDFIGLHIRWFGVFDLCVSEVIWRLLDPGDTAIDVGANLGYITSLMAARTGKTGKVLAIEPHPELYQELLTNLHNWQQMGCTNVHAENLAMGDHTGTAILRIPADFYYNRGLASLEPSAATPSQNAPANDRSHDDRSYTVQLRPLDDLINTLTVAQVGVLKVDVEGHELAVLKGAQHLISQHRVRDIVFEDFGQYPTPVTQLLEDQGYRLFYLSKSFWGLCVGAIQNNPLTSTVLPEGPSYLATTDPDRALNRLKHWGWDIFGIRGFNYQK
jgi:FkbM family methyltransferase